jgi:hypothetical protein
VKAALLAAGCLTFDMLALLPAPISDHAPRAGDERFVTVTGRRPTVEYAVARTAERLLRIVRGTSIEGLLTGPSAAKGSPMSRACARRAAKRSPPISSLTRSDGSRSCRTGWRLSARAVRPRRRRSPASSITPATSALPRARSHPGGQGPSPTFIRSRCSRFPAIRTPGL